jgi:hypothetical protein
MLTPGRIYIEGAVRGDRPFITKIGGFDVELPVTVRAAREGASRSSVLHAIFMQGQACYTPWMTVASSPLPSSLLLAGTHGHQGPNACLVHCSHLASHPQCAQGTLQGSVLLTRQRDQPGVVAGVSTVLAAEGVNISFMTVSLGVVKALCCLALMSLCSDPPKFISQGGCFCAAACATFQLRCS